MSTHIESPFLPGTDIQYAWDATSLEMFKACPRLYYYTMICGWQGRTESVHLRFGIEYHKALQDYDVSIANGIKHDDAVFDVVRELFLRTADWWDDDELMEMRGSAAKKTRKALIRTAIWHMDKYRDDAAKTYIKADGKAAVEQGFRFELNYGPTEAKDQHYVLCGHLDKIVEFAGELYVKDYKTAYSLGPWYFDQFEPHNQMSMYSLAAKVLLEAPVHGVIIDAACLHQTKDEEGTDFQSNITSRTSDQLTEWVEDLRYWLDQAEHCAAMGSWPQNDTSCSRYGGCKFRGVCSKSPPVRERFLEADFVQIPREKIWNPLKPRE